MDLVKRISHELKSCKPCMIWGMLFRLSFLLYPETDITIITILILDIGILWFTVRMTPKISEEMKKFILIFYLCTTWYVQFFYKWRTLSFLLSISWIILFFYYTFELPSYKNYYLWILIINTTLSFYFLKKLSLPECISVFIMLKFILSFLDTLREILKDMYQEKLNKERELIDNNSKSQILAVTSHEIRNPLQALLFLVSNIPENIEMTFLKNFIDDIKFNIDMLNRIVENILDFSKINTDVKINNEDFNLVDVFDHMGNVYIHKAIAKKLGFFIDFDSKIPIKIKGDMTKISEIISNFISNAIKFTDKGRIIISAKLINIKENQCTIEYKCQDTGKGISLENQAKLFKPYQQVFSSQSNEFKGWGLGLSISKNLISLMQGELKFFSEPNVGSIFSFSLNHQIICNQILQDQFKLNPRTYILINDDPFSYNIISKYLKDLNAIEIRNGIMDRTAPKPDDILIILEEFKDQYKDYIDHKCLFIGNITSHDQENVILEPICLKKLYKAISQKKYTKSIDEKPNINEKFILLAEDNLFIHKLEKDILEKYGMTNIQSAYNGLEVMELFEKNYYDLLLLDLNMPKMGGMEIIKNIRNNPDSKRSKTPIIVITGNHIFDLQECLINGANSALSKPIKFEVLFDEIKKFLN